MSLTYSSLPVTFGAGLLSFLSPCFSYLAGAILIFVGISRLFGLRIQGAQRFYTIEDFLLFYQMQANKPLVNQPTGTLYPVVLCLYNGSRGRFLWY